MPINIADYFKYHPVQSIKRKTAHNAINSAALAFALIINEQVENSKMKDQAFMLIQQARMFANQGATLDEISS